MPSDQTEMLRFVAIAVAIKIVAVLALIGSVYLFPDFDNERMPDVSAPVTIAAVAVAISWYTREFNRTLSKGEIFRFATGVTLGDIVISVGVFVLMIIDAGEPLTFAGLNAALSDGEVVSSTNEMLFALVIAMIAGGFFTFLISAFFAWFLTKRLPAVAQGFE